MLRLFNQHEVRIQTEIDGFWDFTPVQDAETIPKVYPYSMCVPSCWEKHPNFLSYRGMGAYRRFVSLKQDGNVKLIFKGISHTAHVFWDGVKIGMHYNAYTPFDFIIECAKAGRHELVVIADNRFSEKSALHVPNDYETYGGIIRPVAFDLIPDVFIQRVLFTPIFIDGKWSAEIAVTVKNIASKDVRRHVRARLEGVSDNLDFGIVTAKSKAETVIAKKYSFDGVKEWSAETPVLYFLKTVMLNESDAETDDFIERVAFRTVRTSGINLLVNGKPVRLIGFNRHEDHGNFGSAIPIQAMAHDLDLIQDIGANTVRTSHYPNDERFLDACDERGLFVWEENHARGLPIEKMRNPNFAIQCAQCNEEMVQNHYNHPSIIIWGILNECASDTEEGKEHYKNQLEQIRGLDQSRPLTFATCRPFTDVSLDLCDIVSFNLYSSWYKKEDTGAFFERLYEWVQASGGKDKPFIMSEFGAGAIYGMRDPARPKWSEEYQCDALEKELAVYCNRPEICGAIIWQFCDIKITNEGNFWLSRPGTRNNKGVVDIYRRPKLAYDVVKKHFKSIKK